MNMFLGSVGLVTLSLGAIGIVNIMLVAVADRTREIGLRKALGATNRSIMFQFFTEGAFLTVLSGGVGIGGGAGFMARLSKFPSVRGGMAMVVLLVGYGNGFGRAIQAIWDSYGSTAVGIYPGHTSQQAGGNKAGVEVHFTQDDVEMISNVVPLVKHVSRALDMTATVQAESRSFSFSVFGIDPGIQAIWNLSVYSGRLVNIQDNFSHCMNAVQGSETQ